MPGSPPSALKHSEVSSTSAGPLAAARGGRCGFLRQRGERVQRRGQRWRQRRRGAAHPVRCAASFAFAAATSSGSPCGRVVKGAARGSRPRNATPRLQLRQVEADGVEHEARAVLRAEDSLHLCTRRRVKKRRRRRRLSTLSLARAAAQQQPRTLQLLRVAGDESDAQRRAGRHCCARDDEGAAPAAQRGGGTRRDVRPRGCQQHAPRRRGAPHCAAAQGAACRTAGHFQHLPQLRSAVVPPRGARGGLQRNARVTRVSRRRCAAVRLGREAWRKHRRRLVRTAAPCGGVTRTSWSC